MPKESILKFSYGQGQLKAPFVKFMQTLNQFLEPMSTCSNDPMIPYTNHINKHTPSGFCTYSTFAYGNIENPLKLCRGKDCIDEFCKYMREEACRLYNMFPEKSMIPLNPKQWKEYNESSQCHICLKPITEKNIKVRDHCHYTGEFRGPAHRMCNLRYIYSSGIHNLSGYDARLFI